LASSNDIEGQTWRWGTTNGTTAQKLINILDNMEGMAYVTYTDEHVSHDAQLAQQLSIPP
jgi:hypothetical protein